MKTRVILFVPGEDVHQCHEFQTVYDALVWIEYVQEWRPGTMAHLVTGKYYDNPML